MANFLHLNKPESISIGYLVLGIVWISLSDRLVDFLFSDDLQAISRFQFYKGTFYVTVTTLLLYFLIKRLYDQAHQRNQELELLFTNPDLGIIKLDEKGYFKELNKNMERVSGYSKDELLGKHFLEFTPEDQKQFEKKEFQRALHEHPEKGFSLQKQFLGKNGRVTHLLVYGMEIQSTKKGPKTYIAAFQNITELMVTLDQLKNKNQQLIELAHDQSHFVRAPLARILAITHLMNDGDLLDEKDVRDFISKLRDSSEELDKQLRKISQKMMV